MSRIQVMSATLASQVAAGEVVERPASVVKELVENALDAGARAIEVEIQKGGVRLIRVQDDGGGMNREEAELAFERHATSKLKSMDDLVAVKHLGFRGEALPSIASVARVSLQTLERGAISGTEVLIEGGQLIHVKEAGVASGTRIEVRDLFFNVPARRKFLKAETTESAHVEHQVRLHALAHPRVRFTFRKDGRTVYDLPGTEDLRVRVAGLLGREMGRELLAIKGAEKHGIRVYGQVLPGHHARKGRRHQCVFLNGRPIEDVAVSSALRDAYRGLVQDGLHPTVFLVIEMNPSEVDVNVHPAKREVRFHQPHRVREAVLEAVEASLFPPDEAPEPDELPEAVARPAFLRPVERQKEMPISPELPVEKTERLDPEPEHRALTGIQPVPASESPPVRAKTPCPEWRFLSELKGRYLLFEGEDGLVMMDPVAARERIWYERLLLGHEQEAVPAQGLLVPELIELDARDLDVALTHQEFFREAGIKLDGFGGHTLRVNSVPDLVKIPDLRRFITALIDELVENVGARRGKTVAFQSFASRLARHLARSEGPCRDGADELLNQLFDCELPYCNAGGSPTLIHLSLKEVQRRFS